MRSSTGTLTPWTAGVVCSPTGRQALLRPTSLPGRARGRHQFNTSCIARPLNSKKGLPAQKESGTSPAAPPVADLPAVADHAAVGPIYRSPLAWPAAPGGGHTLWDMWSDAVARYQDRRCLGRRVGSSYEYLSFKEAGEMVGAVSGAMAHVGMKAHDRACMFGVNSPELMIAIQACNRSSVYCVPLYDVLGDYTVEYIIQHSESSIVFVAADKLPVLARALSKCKPPLKVKNVILWGKDAPADALKEIAGFGITVHNFNDFVNMGRAHPTPPVPPKAQDICTIMYTSGTTGTPKGVLLTHRALASDAASLMHWMRSSGSLEGDDHVYLSFLPLAHIYGRCIEESFLSAGCCIAYWSGEAKGLPADIRASQPTIFCSVPRVLERFESNTLDKVSKASKFQQLLFHAAFKSKLAAIKAGQPWKTLASLVWDPLVFKKVSSAMLGDHIHIVTSGGAPLAGHLEDFMRVTCCCTFLQGYGLTETCGATFVSHPDDPAELYTVGQPQPAFELRLEAVPDMEYDPGGDPPRGEVLVRGEGLFSGYYKDEKETRRVMDGEGWFHTGDIGEVTPGSALRIIDRKKNIFKLSQGEYVAVEKIENVLDDSEHVNQVWVHGSRFESSLVAVVVPSKSKLQAWAKEHGIEGSVAELCGNTEVRSMLHKEVESTGRRGGLKPFELPKAIYVEAEPFSVANDLLAPSLELRRHQLLKKYAPVVEKLYGDMKAKAAKSKPKPTTPR